MPSHDMSAKTEAVLGVASQTLTGSSTSAAIDTRNFGELLVIATVGTATITPSTANKFTVLVKESSSSAGTYTGVSATNIIGGVSGSTIGAIIAIDTTAKPSNVYTASVLNTKRWIRVGATESGTAALRIGIAVLGGRLNYAPQ